MHFSLSLAKSIASIANAVCNSRELPFSSVRSQSYTRYVTSDVC